MSTEENNSESEVLSDESDVNVQAKIGGIIQSLDAFLHTWCLRTISDVFTITMSGMLVVQSARDFYYGGGAEDLRNAILMTNYKAVIFIVLMAMISITLSGVGLIYNATSWIKINMVNDCLKKWMRESQLNNHELVYTNNFFNLVNSLKVWLSVSFTASMAFFVFYGYVMWMVLSTIVNIISVVCVWRGRNRLRGFRDLAIS